MTYGAWNKAPDVIDPKEPTDPLSALYRAVWSRFGGRPYTYMIRDAWHQYPLMIILAGVVGGNVMLFIGCVLGHLFWGE